MSSWVVQNVEPGGDSPEHEQRRPIPWHPPQGGRAGIGRVRGKPELDKETQTSIVLFDGECNLCHRSVGFILRRDPAQRFQFASLQSPAAHRLLQQAGHKLEALPDSIVLLEKGALYTRSTAALRIAGRLRGLWPLLSIFLLVPTRLRDWVYDWVARNRYRLFGKQEACLLPTPEMQGRFLQE